ncbi:DUF6301 domain-containing protein [Nocardia ninae]|uniref:Uncharacterized protein n=1 Tax=Nocardia ninae NBRC 108245 TaxID=1210091 RepID=A0A511ME59_9NOCA|nr:DUF6301 family protein [Nocardia ninae]GEM38954.1 hypothetical protein NN4_34730 [Nocardia ninae NBRC 108245]
MTEWRALSDAEIIELATRLLSLDWSWQMSEVPELASAFGWQIQSARPRSVILDVGFGMASGRVHGRDSRAEIVELAVTTRATGDGAERALVLDTFARMTTALTTALGAPARRIPGELPEIRWAGEETTLRLLCMSSSVRLSLETNSWLALHDETIELQEQGLI